MALPEQDRLMEALRAADAAGDSAAASAIARRLATVRGNTEMQEGFADSFKKIGEGAIASAASMGQTLLKPVGWASPQAKQYLGRSQEISDRMKQEAGGFGTAGGLAMDVAGTGGMGGIAKAGLTRAASAVPTMLPRVAQALKAPVTTAATEGMASGAYLTPQDPGGGAVAGGIGGAVGQQVLGRALNRAATPIDLRRFGDTEALMDRGVPMTVGLGANPNTNVGRGVRLLEETLSAVPFIGSSIRTQREAARQAWRDVPLKDVAAAAQVPEPSRAGFASHTQMQDEVQESIGKRYDLLLQGKTLRPTAVLARNLDNIVNNPMLSMTPADRKRVRSLVEAHIYDRQLDMSQTPTTAPRAIKATDIFKAQSDLRKLGNKAMQSDLSSEQAYGKALVNSADEIYKFIERRYPTIGKQLQDLRAPYSELSTLRSAAEKAGVRGEFTPTELGRKAITSGNEPLKQWSAMAEPLLTKDPGQLSNLARLSLLTGGGILVGSGALPVAAAATLLFGTKTGQRGLKGELAMQKKLSELLARRPELANRLSSILGRETALGLKEKKE